MFMRIKHFNMFRQLKWNFEIEEKIENIISEIHEQKDDAALRTTTSQNYRNENCL